jgi:hypothetical protein
MKSFTKPIIYFFIAAGTMLSQAKEPENPWGWVILLTGCAVQGFVALRALYSEKPDHAPKTEPPTP